MLPEGLPRLHPQLSHQPDRRVRGFIFHRFQKLFTVSESCESPSEIVERKDTANTHLSGHSRGFCPLFFEQRSGRLQFFRPKDETIRPCSPIMRFIYSGRTVLTFSWLTW